MIRISSLFRLSTEEIASNTFFLLLFLSEQVPRAQANEEDEGEVAGPEQGRTADRISNREIRNQSEQATKIREYTINAALRREGWLAEQIDKKVRRPMWARS